MFHSVLSRNQVDYKNKIKNKNKNKNKNSKYEQVQGQQQKHNNGGADVGRLTSTKFHRTITVMAALISMSFFSIASNRQLPSVVTIVPDVATTNGKTNYSITTMSQTIGPNTTLAQQQQRQPSILLGNNTNTFLSSQKNSFYQQQQTKAESILQTSPDQHSEILISDHPPNPKSKDRSDIPLQQTEQQQQQQFEPFLGCHDVNPHVRIGSLWNSHQTTGSTSINNSISTPILVVGLPKVGTTSIAKFLRRAGYSVSHWYCKKTFDDAGIDRETLKKLLNQHAKRTRGMGQEKNRNKNSNRNRNNNPQTNNTQKTRSLVRFSSASNTTIIDSQQQLRRQLRVPRNPKMPGGHIYCGQCLRNTIRRLQIDKPLEACGNTQVFTQLDVELMQDELCYFPQILDLQRLSTLYPQATFILNMRNVSHWIRSIQGWYGGDKQGTMAARLASKYCAPIGPKSNSTNDLEEWYCRHVHRIRKFVSTHPTHTYIELDIEHESTGQRLATLFESQSNFWTQANSNPRINEGQE